MKFEMILKKLRKEEGSAFRKAWRHGPHLEGSTWLHMGCSEEVPCLMLITFIGESEWRPTSEDLLAEDWFFVPAVQIGGVP